MPMNKENEFPCMGTGNVYGLALGGVILNALHGKSKRLLPEETQLEFQQYLAEHDLDPKNLSEPEALKIIKEIMDTKEYVDYLDRMEDYEPWCIRKTLREFNGKRIENLEIFLEEIQPERDYIELVSYINDRVLEFEENMEESAGKSKSSSTRKEGREAKVNAT